MVDFAFYLVLLGALSSFVLSIGIEQLMRPKPSFLRPLSCFGIQFGLWCLVYAFFIILLGRPWFITSGLTFLMLLLVVINHTKLKTLKEPLIFQDYEYVIDIILYPRLYIPFFGFVKTVIGIFFFLLLVAIAWHLEPVPVNRFSLQSQLGAAILLIVPGGFLLYLSSRPNISAGSDLLSDFSRLGFIPTLWHYGILSRQHPVSRSPFETLSPKNITDHCSGRQLPHLVAVQSESFFDARCLFSGISTDVLANFDRLKETAIHHGKLTVPAWGANTVRTEFSFLSGIDEKVLGVHRFNPFSAITSGWDVASLATFLKRLGYYTVCVHPYPASFYLRHHVYPKLGFDAFLDIRHFDKTQTAGPYISDLAVTQKIIHLIKNKTAPVFVFAITMENHGPLHLEKIGETELDLLYHAKPPAYHHDLSVYLRHLRNADQMIATLANTLSTMNYPASLCWFGDHVPIMPSVYKALGEPSGVTDYIIWSNHSVQPSQNPEPMPSFSLGITWLKAMHLI